MEFDKSRIYSAGNADELKAGDKVCVADTLMGLENRVRHECVAELEEVLPDYNEHRFKAYLGIHNLAYLVERKENCTNCGAIYTCAFQVREHPELEKCKNWKPKNEPKTEQKNCYNCGLTYMRDGDKICKINGCRIIDLSVPCSYWKLETEQKAEKKYRPFKDVDELVKVWDAKIGTPNWGTDGDLTMPHIWVRRKESNCKGQLITKFSDPLWVIMSTEGYNMTDLFEHFTFLDGSVCGVEE